MVSKCFPFFYGLGFHLFNNTNFMIDSFHGLFFALRLFCSRHGVMGRPDGPRTIHCSTGPPKTFPAKKKLQLKVMFPPDTYPHNFGCGWWLTVAGQAGRAILGHQAS